MPWPVRLRLILPESPGRGRLHKECVMTKPTKDQIIHRAYELWEQAGKPEGRDDEFYHQAERELNEASEPPSRLPG